MKARHTPRVALFYPVPKQEGKAPANILVTRFHPHHDYLRDIVSGHWDMLGKNNTTNRVFEEGFLVGLHRPKNLRDILQ